MNEVSIKNKKPIKIGGIIVLGLVAGVASVLWQLYLIFILVTILLILLFINWKNKNKFIYLLLIMIIFQNFFAIILSGLGKPLYVTLLISLKELYVYGCVFFFCLLKKKNKSKRLNIINWLAFIYLSVIALYFIFPNNLPLFVKSISGRQLIMPVILFLFGYFTISSPINLLASYTRISLVIVAFGFIESWILGDEFWIDLGIKHYMENKGMSLWAYGTQGLPGNFYTFDFVYFTGVALRRMVSFIADPTLLGQFLVVPLLYSVFGEIKNHREKIFYAVFLSVGLFMTLSKGAILSVLIGFLFILFLKKDRSSQLFALFLSYIFIFFMLIILSNYQLFSSLPAHFNGFLSNLAVVESYPLGLGLGRSGNFANLYNTGDSSEAGESFIGAMLGQTGIAGTFLFLLLIILVIWSLVKKYTKDNDNNFLIIAGALTGTVLISLISESAISFISSGMIFVLAGVYLSSGIGE
ncbi:MAG: polymerase [Sporolactobacillus sp.]|jgi:hypothetical protein|nr:polymerase [Sporolactobacillus sp.]